jgi:hypothetical protein
MRKRLAALTGFALVGLTASICSSSSSPPIARYADREPDIRIEMKRDVTLDKTDAQPILRTQEFEAGQVTMKKVESVRLERFLQDLNHRRDFDTSQHNGKPGPNHDYLTMWVQKTMDELFARGYYVDKHGDLHRHPGEVVPTR